MLPAPGRPRAVVAGSQPSTRGSGCGVILTLIITAQRPVGTRLCGASPHRPRSNDLKSPGGRGRWLVQRLQPRVHLLDLVQTVLDRLEASAIPADLASDDVEISQLLNLGTRSLVLVDPARTGPAVKLRRLRLLASRASRVGGLRALGRDRMQGQVRTSYAVWDVRND